jgi:hypothetical protein
VQEDVAEHAAPEAVAQRHQRAHLRRRDPIDRAAQPGLEGHVLERLEQQRIEVEHAELAVADPGLALPQALERADVHEHRPGALELHVVGRGVLQHEVVAERFEQQVELQQRGVLEHRERPLVGIRDERDALVAKHAGRLVHQQRAIDVAVLDQLGADDASVVEQPRGLERLEVAQPIRGQRAIDLVTGVEDAALGVAERARLEAGEHCPPPAGLLRAAGRRVDLRDLRLVLADAKQSEQAMPIELRRHGKGGHATDDDLGDVAAGAGVEIGEKGRHGGTAG